MLIVILGFILLASLLTWYLLHYDHGRRISAGTLWIAIGFGILAMLLATLIESAILPKALETSPSLYPLSQRLIYFVAVGIVEEMVKFVPLALFIYKKPYFKEHTDGIIYFAICGLTFGLGENIGYTISFGASAGITRLILMPFFHAAATAILGYYLVSMKIDRKNKTKFIAALIIIPLLHGLYDFGLLSGVYQLVIMSLVITLLLSIGLFLYFMEANDLDKAALLSIASRVPNFCPSCGKANSYHRQFCENCGRQLYSAKSLDRA
ncbi:MAG TPA: PrsW family glutamic-type intramembrane protease [Candidatus Sulfotelmatobacter sp.]|nr:PrsW family glutamic-type intramembrane protease [Candidatus Sulfotelmatobacter sp.]